MMEVPGDYRNVEFFATVPSFLSLKVTLTFSCLRTPGARETVTHSSPARQGADAPLRCLDLARSKAHGLTVGNHHCELYLYPISPHLVFSSYFSPILCVADDNLYYSFHDIHGL